MYTSDDDDFLRAIAAAPNDLAPRLVYADWLDERDDPRGTFLRLEMALAELAPTHPDAARLRQELHERWHRLPDEWCRRVRVPKIVTGAAAWTIASSPWAVTASGATTMGAYREVNQDAFLLDETKPFALVLDGMGNASSGTRAATLGATVVQRVLADGPAPSETVAAHMERAFRAASEEIRALQTTPEERGTSATIVAAIVRDARVHVAWAGDSQAYCVSGGTVTPLTWVHDYRNTYCRMYHLSDEEAKLHMWRNVLVHHLNAELPDPFEVPYFTPLVGDRLLLTTDGVHNLMSPAELAATCADYPDAQECALQLVWRALVAGSRDNTTCVVLAFDSHVRRT